MDNTTLLTGVTLLSDAGAEAMTPLTVWDLATFVRAVVSYERIYHHEHPRIDDRAINRRLGQEVLCAVPLPTQGSTATGPSPLPEPWNGFHRFMCELWDEAISWLKRLAAHPGIDTLDGHELVTVRDAWRHALHRNDIQVEDLSNWRDASIRWISPSDDLLREIARGTDASTAYADLGPSSALRKHAATLGRPDPAIGPWLTDVNLRAYINQAWPTSSSFPTCAARRGCLSASTSTTAPSRFNID